MPLLLLLALPFIEITLFIVVGDAIGVFYTLALVVLAALVGIGLIQRSGLATIATAQQSMQRGEMPVEALFTTVCRVLAGILLFIPGFFTDLVALVLLIPGMGGWLARVILKSANRRGFTYRGQTPRGRAGSTQPNSPAEPGSDIVETRIIDVQYEEVNKPESPHDKPGKD